MTISGMNFFTCTLVIWSILFYVVTCFRSHRTFQRRRYSNQSNLNYHKHSNLYIEEDFLPSFKRGKIDLILNEHNKYRDLHSAPNLELDRETTYEAEVLAEMLSNVNYVTMPENYGINIWYKETSDVELFMEVDNLNPVRIWYKDFVNYTGPWQPTENSRSFTQLVWKSSRKLGVGFTYSALVVYVVCYYDPPGNVIDYYNNYLTAHYFRQNVHPPKNSTNAWRDATPNLEIAWKPLIVYMTLLVLLSVFYTILRIRRLEIYTFPYLFRREAVVKY